jgi:ABC-type molybdate transport system substrate-binding protein
VGASNARAALVISGDTAPRIVYPAAIVSRAPNRTGAEQLLTYLRSPAAAAIFARFKFVPLGQGG